MPFDSISRRQAMTLGATAAVSAISASGAAAAPTVPADKVFRIGVISASIEGKPQRTNGHTWHFCHPFHPTINEDAVKKYLDAGTAKITPEIFRNPKLNFDQMPFVDTRLTHVYAADATAAKMFAEGYPGVVVAPSVEQMVQEVDAVWLGDASGTGSDHLELIAPALEKGLPTFCDKPIGGSVARTRQILELAEKHKAPLMSSSLFRHQWGTAEALRMKESGEHGPLQFVLASQGGGYSPNGWIVYGQHPTWMAMTLCGPGVQGVSMYAHGDSSHGAAELPRSHARRGMVRAAGYSRAVLSDHSLLSENAIYMDARDRRQLLARPQLPGFPDGGCVSEDDPNGG